MAGNSCDILSSAESIQIQLTGVLEVEHPRQAAGVLYTHRMFAETLQQHVEDVLRSCHACSALRKRWDLFRPHVLVARGRITGHHTVATHSS